MAESRQNRGRIVAESWQKRCRHLLGPKSCRNGRIAAEARQNRGRSVAESPNDQPHRQRQSSARNVAESWQKRGRTRLRTPLRPHKRRRRDRHTDRAPTRYGRAHAASLPAPGPRSRANALRGVHCVLLTGAGSLFPEHTSATPTILRGSSRATHGGSMAYPEQRSAMRGSHDPFMGFPGPEYVVEPPMCGGDASGRFADGRLLFAARDWRPSNPPTQCRALRWQRRPSRPVVLGFAQVDSHSHCSVRQVGAVKWHVWPATNKLPSCPCTLAGKQAFI